MLHGKIVRNIKILGKKFEIVTSENNDQNDSLLNPGHEDIHSQCSVNNFQGIVHFWSHFFYQVCDVIKRACLGHIS